MNIIHQGKLDPNLSSNGIIIENNVLAEIINLELVDCFGGIIEVSLKLLSGEGIGKIVKDKVCFLRNDKLTWKYFDLRESAFCPYDKDESERIDIDELLLNKRVEVNLDAWEGVTMNGRNYTKQKVNYVLPSRQKHKDIKSYNDSIVYDLIGDNVVESDINQNPFGREDLLKALESDDTDNQT